MKKLILAGSCLILSLLTNSANAALQYWDPEGTFSYATLPDGYAGSLAQTWENSLWSTASSGTATGMAWITDVAAVFSTGSGINTPAFTVTMNATHTIAGFFDGSLAPNSSQVTLAGTGTAIMESGNLNGYAGDNSSDGSLSVMIFDLPIGGSSTAGIACEDTGQVYLNAANTYSGGTYLGYINWSLTTGSASEFATIWNYNNNMSWGTSNIYILFSGGGALVAEGTGSPSSFTLNITNNIVNVEPDTNSSYINSGVNFAHPSLNFVGLPFTNGGSVFSGKWIMSGGVSLSGSEGYANSAPLTSYAPLLFRSTGAALGSGGYGATPMINIAGQIVGTNNLQFGAFAANGGTNIVMLSANNPFSGNITIGNGTLMLSNNGAIPNVPSLTIVTNAVFDITNLTAGYTWPSSQMLIAQGAPSGQTSVQGGGTFNAPTINGLVGVPVNLGTAPINLTYNGDYVDSMLNITANNASVTTLSSLTLNNNTIALNNTTGSLFGGSPAYYYLITSGGSWNNNNAIIAGGTITGSPYKNVVVYTNNPTFNAASNGLAANLAGVIIQLNGTVAMQMNAAPNATTVTLAAPSAISYGGSPSIQATVSPDPTVDPNGGGVVQFFRNGVPLGSAVPVVSGGTATYTAATSLLTPAGPNVISAVYSGSGTTAGSDYAASATTATVSQTVNKATLTVTATAQTVTYGTAPATGAGKANITVSGLVPPDALASSTATLTINSGGPGGVPAGSIGTTNEWVTQGTPYTIVPSAAVLTDTTGGSFNAANYTETYANGQLTVNPYSTMTITATAESQPYGGTTTFGAGSTAFTVNATKNGITAAAFTVTTACSDGTSTTPAGTYTGAITASTPVAAAAPAGTNFSPANFNISYVAGNMTVNPRAVSLTGSETYNDSTAINGSSLTVANAINGDIVTVGGTTTMASVNAGPETLVVPGSLSLGGAQGGNYTLTGGSGTETVAQLPVSLTGTEASGTTTASGSILTVANALGTDSPTVNPAGTVDLGSPAPSAGACPILIDGNYASLAPLTGAGAANYTLTGGGGTVTLTGGGPTGFTPYSITSSSIQVIGGVSNLVVTFMSTNGNYYNVETNYNLKQGENTTGVWTPVTSPTMPVQATGTSTTVNIPLASGGTNVFVLIQQSTTP